MDNEKEDDLDDDSKSGEGTYFHISTYWQYLTISSSALSIIALAMIEDSAYPRLESSLMWLCFVSVVLHVVVGFLAVCRFCGKPLTFRPPLYSESQGKLFLFPLEKCWSCKRQLRKPQWFNGDEN